jgi:peptide-methionine (S)-S-oxide reductase
VLDTGQGADSGTQYRSAIFYHSPEQKETALKILEEVKEKHPLVIQGGKIVTEITEAGKWWDGETYHQEYLDNNPGGYVCATHRLWW